MSDAMTADRPRKPKVARAPRVGDAVLYWVADPMAGLKPLPATLIERMSNLDLWAINAQRVGGVYAVRGCPHADTPRVGHWTWPDAVE